MNELEKRKEELLKRMNGKRRTIIILNEGDSLLPEQEKTLQERGYRWQERRIPAGLELIKQRELAEELSNEADIIIFASPVMPLPLVKLCSEATYEWHDWASGYGARATVFVLQQDGELV